MPLPALWLLEVPEFASTWLGGSAAEIGLRSAFALAPGARLLLWRHAEEFGCAPRTLTSQPDHEETAEPEDANNALRPKAGRPRRPGSHLLRPAVSLSWLPLRAAAWLEWAAVAWMRPSAGPVGCDATHPSWRS